jgi:dTDP-4-dehydrorhamnose 3,5-epimerase
MKFASTPIAGVWQVHTEPRADARGSFTRLYCAEAFDAVMPGLCFVQANLSHTLQRGTLRGLHLQRAPAQEYKLVRCLRGHVFDVAADLRPLSITYGQWFALELSDRNHCQLLIPPGVAHGFQALSDDVQLLYQHSTAFDAKLEDGVRHDDPSLAIDWPLPVRLLSPRDRQLRLLQAAATEAGSASAIGATTEAGA